MIKNLLLGCLALALVACGQNEGGNMAEPQFAVNDPVASKQYVFAIHSLHHPARRPLCRFELADDQRYRKIEDFFRKFSQTVYPLHEPKR